MATDIYDHSDWLHHQADLNMFVYEEQNHVWVNLPNLSGKKHEYRVL